MAQMTAPESIVRAIFLAGPSPTRSRVLAALGLADDGTPCSDGERATALAELVGPQLDDDEVPF